MNDNITDDVKPAELHLGIKEPAPVPPAPVAPAPVSPAEQAGPFYSPPPSSQESASSARPRWQMAVASVLVATGLGLGAWYGFAPGNNPQANPTIPAASAPVRFDKLFSVSKLDADYKATEYLKNLLSGRTPNTKDDNESLHAVNAPALKAIANNSPQTAEEIKSGRRVLYRMYLLDFLEEDGDHVEMFVDGVSYGDLYLRNAGKEILIPLTKGKPTLIKLLATVDGGGGGVTVGMVSSLGEARTRVMAVGQSEEWQVTVQ